MNHFLKTLGGKSEWIIEECHNSIYRTDPHTTWLIRFSLLFYSVRLARTLGSCGILVP